MTSKLLLALASGDENINTKSPYFISNSSGDFMDVLKEPKLLDHPKTTDSSSEKLHDQAIKTLMIDSDRKKMFISKNKVAKMIEPHQRLG